MGTEHVTGIYEIVNTANGKRYVGSAVNFHYRWGKHLSELRRGVHHSRYLQSAWNKSGPEAFEFRKLAICSRENLLLYEQAAFDAFKPEYNVRVRAESAIGVKRSPEYIAKWKAGRLASGGWVQTPEARVKISATLKGRPGTPKTQEQRAAASVARKGKITPHLVALFARKVGVPRAPEVRVALSKANALLTEDQVREVRRRCAKGEKQKDVGVEFGLRQSCVSEIVRFVTYKWVN